jgi:hypothetical protein
MAIWDEVTFQPSTMSWGGRDGEGLRFETVREYDVGLGVEGDPCIAIVRAEQRHRG